MLRNYLTIAIRSTLRHKMHSLINIIGLAVGMAVCVSIMLWVQDEISFDRFHSHVDQLYRVSTAWDKGDVTEHSSLTPEPLVPELRATIPEIEYAARFDNGGVEFIKYDGQSFFDDRVAIVDPDFIKMFSFDLTAGDVNTALNDRYSVVVSESMARKYFGDREAIGQVLNIDRRDFTVTAVMQDVPSRSHLRFDCLVSFDSRSDWLKKITNAWNASAYYSYVKLHDGVAASTVIEKIEPIMNEHNPESKYSTALGLQSITDIHLHHEIRDYIEGHGDIGYVYLFASLALLVLLVACFNYTNLTTARMSMRVREIGVRKVVGASRSHLIRQFMSESFLTTLLALAFAIILVEIALPMLNEWSGKQLALNLFGDLQTSLGLLLVALVTSLLSGLYPAVYLSSRQPADAVRKGSYRVGKGAALRKVLVVVQFGVSVVLIVGSIVIGNQLSHVRNTDLGFDKDHLLYLNMRGDFITSYPAIKEELVAHPAIVDVTAGDPPIRRYATATEVSIGDGAASDDLRMTRVAVDLNYFSLLGMDIIDGRGFGPDGASAPGSGFILNETAVKVAGLNDPIGASVVFKSYDESLTKKEFSGTVIGVVRDFHNGPLRTAIEPTLMYYGPDEFYSMCVRVRPERTAEVISMLRTMWETRVPDLPFDYHFVDETIESFYRSEMRFSEILTAYTSLAIFISCLGLFGLAAFSAEQRSKEIGIRRVLGSSVRGVVALLSREFVLLVLIANLIACPIAYLLMNDWLENFAYRTDLGVGTFVLAATLSMLITLCTVAFQAIKAARSNPVEALKHD